jgi:uncharacterized protein
MIDLPLLILDTNVVLDWLVFRDARVQILGQWLAHQQVRWLTTLAMHQEFMYVLARPGMQVWAPDLDAVHQAWHAHAHTVPAAGPAPWRCRDLSDQMFLDLAAAYRASALLTRDRSLLTVARRARANGLVISTPELWIKGRQKTNIETEKEKAADC